MALEPGGTLNLQAPVTHFLPLTAIRRERTLPSPGRVLVRAGQNVAASEIIAEMNLNPEYHLLDIPYILGISIQKADRIILCKPGDRLPQGDLIAGPVGIQRRLSRQKQLSGNIGRRWTGFAGDDRKPLSIESWLSRSGGGADPRPWRGNRDLWLADPGSLGEQPTGFWYIDDAGKTGRPFLFARRPRYQSSGCGCCSRSLQGC